MVLAIQSDFILHGILWQGYSQAEEFDSGLCIELAYLLLHLSLLVQILPEESITHPA